MEKKVRFVKYADAMIAKKYLTIGEVEKRTAMVKEFKEARNRGLISKEAYDEIADLLLG